VTRHDRWQAKAVEYFASVEGEPEFAEERAA
jgi:hypothetical protein